MTCVKQYSSKTSAQMLAPLLHHLTYEHDPIEEDWHGWRIVRLASSSKNQLYRATQSGADVVIKYFIRSDDSMARAWREYHALLTLRQAGVLLAPAPILFDSASYPQPVLVQTWIDGQVNAEPPQTETEWRALLQYMIRLHTTTTRLPYASQGNVAHLLYHAQQRIWQHVACLPATAHISSLHSLLRHFKRARFPTWAYAPVALCRCDNNILNFIRRVDGWISVDWEFSRWGDPAYDVADLIMHAAYTTVSPLRWEWFIDTYGRAVNDSTFAIRIQTYAQILVVGWTIRFARYLAEKRNGCDRRILNSSEDWYANRLAKYEHYVALADILDL